MILDVKSRVHPRYKTKYRVGNWPAYDRALVQRGDVTLWLTPEAIATWEAVGVGKRGGQLQYSEVAIETALTLRLIFHLPLRQTEGFLRSIFGMLCLDLSAPDHTTLSRRGQHLDLALRRLPAGAGIHLIVDSTGLSTVGEGEWAAVKHGGRGIRGWKKLHLGVDGSGVIVAHALTGGHVDDATTALDLIDKVEGNVSCLTADAAYDTRGIYEAAEGAGDRQSPLQRLQPVDIAMRVAECVGEQAGDLARRRKLSRWADLVDLWTAETHQRRLQVQNPRVPLRSRWPPCGMANGRGATRTEFGTSATACGRSG